MTILPLTYLGSVGWFERLMGNDCTIDLGEHYVKQTERNRCRVLTAAGVANLTVPVIAGGSQIKKPMRDVRIDHSQHWEARHWQTLRSAYGRAPYFEHYAERFEPIYRRHWEFLADLNLELLDIAAGILKCRDKIRLSETYIQPAENSATIAATPALTSKTATLDLRSAEITSNSAPYIQVFADRHPFVPNLSIVDAIFNNGQLTIK